jgi:hypothetical protein
MKLNLTERAFVPRSLRESTLQPQAANLDFAPEGYRPRGEAACNRAPITTCAPLEL